MPPLPPNLRKDLEKAVIQARDAAERAATAALRVLAVDSERAFDTMSEDQKAQRTALRARMRALAPTDTAHGGLSDQRPRGFGPLVEEVAYEQWHRMLFARFLAENDLLIHPELGVSVSLEECAELAAAEGEPDEWMVAAKYASAMLPGIFRRDDPSAQVRFAADGRAGLERILKALPAELFHADDALGWVYQFWQTKAKDEVNKSGRKVGGKDLAPVTQLFTEHYMVRFLLENSLGAWWAARHPQSPILKEWEYLRFREDGTPAAGTFDGWPATAAEVTVMDPCCGSGHFLVAAADMLRKMRTEEEGLSEVEASAAVLRDNLFGLELDPRCTQIAVFALAFDAWKRGLRPPAAGGTPVLPNIACSGISVGGQLNEWTKLAGDDVNLKLTFERLYELFKDAPELGSLIDPNDMAVRDRMFLRDYREVASLVETVLAKGGHDPAAAVFGADAQGVARGGNLLARRYTLVATNPPYRGAGDLTDRIKQLLGSRFGDGQGNLATAFVLRCREFAEGGGSYAMVVIQEWLFLKTYEELRRRFLTEQTLCHVARLGSRAFETIPGERVNVALIIATQAQPSRAHLVTGIDASVPRRPSEKADRLRTGELPVIAQSALRLNPNSTITLHEIDSSNLLGTYAYCSQGTSTGDNDRFVRYFWEMPSEGHWARFQGPPAMTQPYGGRERLVDWRGVESESTGAAIRGRKAWGRRGVAIGQMSGLPATLFDGDRFSNSTPVIVPEDDEDLPAIWAFCSSTHFSTAMRKLNPKMSIDNGYVGKTPFVISEWKLIARELYPDGIPEPDSNDPTQWLFNGNIHGSDSPLHVAVARLLGYGWPEQPPDALCDWEDEDGIVSLTALQGEKGGAERMRAFLALAYGEGWTAGTLDGLLADVGYAGKSLEQWLRDGFFEQHCKLFHHRPFIWQIWDGRRDGFSALVNYHRLDRAKLQKLAYTYVGAWMERQRDEKARGASGADDRLAAAQGLQQKLALILEGESAQDGRSGHDIHVRWKPLEKQPIGWMPDVEDGVRMNIRPFVAAGILRWTPNISWRPDGRDRVNDLHFTIGQKQEARRKTGVAL